MAERGDYGVDAPYVPVLMLAGVAALGIIGALVGSAGPAIGGLGLLLSAASYLFATRSGKFTLWQRLLGDLGLTGDEQVLDMGCGRGAVLVMAARLLPRGRATGVDLWSRSDQSGNAEQTTLSNAELEGVGDRVEVHTGDMTRLPFDPAAFDVVLSSLAIHNISDPAGRRRAVDEAARVLRPGGKLVITDIKATADYAEALRRLGMSEVSRRRLGWRGWFGGPWVATSVVTARKPAPLVGGPFFRRTF